MRRIPLLFLILCAAYLPAFSQGKGLMRTDLISPSPTAANLARYGETPVTYYTGLPNVSIPIFNVTGIDLSVPISLTYNYGGLQPTQKSGWVGLGWSLQAGGVITRAIGDKIDGTTGAHSYDKDSATNPMASQQYLIDSYEHGTFDNLPDVYSFNFGNYSGKFIRYDDSVYVTPYQNIKVTNENGFTIITEDGTRYTFSEMEQTSNRPSEGAPYTIPTFISAWYLTEITNAAGTESIHFYYDSDGTVMQYGMLTQSYMKRINTVGSVPSYPGELSTVYPTKVLSKRLSKIVSNNFTVDFSAGNVRTDIETESGQSRSLDRIRVYTSDGKTVKQVKFNYGYFGESRFLKLQSVVDEGSDTSAEFLKHTFSYHNENSGYGNGPTTMVDRYGYYLGYSISNNMLISNEYYQEGADRTPVFSATVTGALHTITYPTGGKTTFTYEPNRYFVNEEQPYVTRSEYATVWDSTSNHFFRESTFDIGADTYVNLKFIRKPLDPGEPYVPANNATDYEIYEMTFVPNDKPNTGGSYVVGSRLYSGAMTMAEATIGYRTIFLEPGKYLVKAIVDGEEGRMDVILNWEIVSDTPKPGALGPGVRLSQLTHDNGFGKSITKTFSYVDLQGFCSGKILRQNNFNITDFTRFMYDTLSAPGAYTRTEDFITYSSVLAESSGIGLPFYYRRVVEETVSGGEVHRSSYDFEYLPQTQGVEMIKQQNFVHTGQGFVLALKTENWYNEMTTFGFGGMEVYINGEHVYPLNPGDHKKNYGFSLKVEIGGWKYQPGTRQTAFENGQPLVTETINYYNFTGSRNLKATKTINSDNSTLYTLYKYPEDYHVSAGLSAMVSSNMVAAVIEEQVWRKENVSANDSVLVSGKINEYANYRLQKVYVLESSSPVTSLNANGKTSGKYSNLISDTRYKPKIEFIYDDAGHIVQQCVTDDSPISYIWGYEPFTLSGSEIPGKSFPVAEVKNATADAVFFTSFEDQTGISVEAENGGHLAVTGVKVKADTFRIKRNFSGSYQLTYWKKTGSNPWTFIQITLSNPNNYLITAFGSYIDEVRLFPVGAQMTTYSYSAGVVTATCDPNGKFTYYEYDKVNRLKTVRDHNNNIIKTYEYHVKDQYIPD